ncbi:MAG: TonB-dependent receptor [Janthinobacterium lividum]
MHPLKTRRRPLPAVSFAVRCLLSSSAAPLAPLSLACAGLLVPAFAQAQTQSGDVAQSDDETRQEHAGTSGKADVALPMVTVSAPAADGIASTYAGGQVAKGAPIGLLGNQRLINVPFSVTSYTAKTIEDQQARTVADVLDNDPGVRMSDGYGNFAQVFVIRGFRLDGDDISLNGLYGVTPRQLVATDALERVDLFKGANAFVNGVTPGGSGIGGGVNLELKRADDKPLTRVTMDVSGSGELGAHVDVGRRFGDNDQFGIRVNQSARGGETSIDDERRRTGTTAIALDYRGDKVRLSADFVYQRVKIDGGRSVVYVTGTDIPAPPSASHNYGQSWGYSTLEDTLGIVRAEYDFLPGWTAYVTGGVHHDTEHGDYDSPSYNGLAGTTTGNRLGVPYKLDSTSVQAGVRGAFSTGPVTHQFNAGASLTSIQTKSAYDLSYPNYDTSLYDTAEVARPAGTYFGGDLADPGVISHTLVKGVAVSDTLGVLNDRVLFTVGARVQSIGVEGFDYDSGAQTAAYSKSITTPIFGIVFKPMSNLSIYANRSEGLAQGGTAPDTAENRGQVFAPYRSKQIEAGVKYEANRYGATFGVFQIKQPGATTTNNVYGVGGEERHRGIEFSVFGEPLKGLRVLAGASLTDAKLTETAGGVNQGKTAVGVPRYLANAGLEYDIPQVRGLTLTGRWIYTGKQYLDTANAASIQAWNRFDVGARYTTQVARHPVTLRLTVQNVANHAYWASAYGSYLTMGAPRTFLASLSTDF